MQDEVPARRSATVQQLCRDNLPHFWAKGARKQFRPKSDWRAVIDRPARPRQTEAGNQPRAAGDAAQVCVITNPAVCALQLRDQYVETRSQVFAC